MTSLALSSACRDTLPTFMQRYLEFRPAGGQLIPFAGLVLGCKPVLDEWIPSDVLPDFLEFLEGYGLCCRVESIFDFVEESSDLGDIVGGGLLATTRARGRDPSRVDAIGGTAHLVIATDRALLDAATANAWYGLACDGVVVAKPWIDHPRFGAQLGYPDCCRRFFASHNDWQRDNTLYQASRRTIHANALCNSLLKNAGVSYSVHLPCSFECAATMASASTLRRRLHSLAPALVDWADALLSGHYLVLSEWEAYRVDAQVRHADSVEYSSVLTVPTNNPDETLTQLLAEGDEMRIDMGDVIVYSRGSLVGIYESRVDRFGPQMPFLVDFEDPRVIDRTGWSNEELS
jgi:hypothetical protein